MVWSLKTLNMVENTLRGKTMTNKNVKFSKPVASSCIYKKLSHRHEFLLCSLQLHGNIWMDKYFNH